MWYCLATINFLHFAALLFALCSAILIIVSVVSPPPAPERVADLTLQTATKEVDTADTPDERRITIGLSVLLAASIGALWILFR
jgi:SSS family solute:Na+ symporter